MTYPFRLGRPVVETIDVTIEISDNPIDDRADCAPRDPQQLTRGRLRRLSHQPCHRVIERPGMPGPMTLPRHLGDHHPMNPTRHPRSIRFQLDAHHTKIQRPPPPTTTTLVIATSNPTTQPTSLLARPTTTNRHNHHLGGLVELNPLDHRSPIDTHHPRPYAVTQHPVSSTSQPSDSSDRRDQTGCNRAPTHEHVTRATKFDAPSPVTDRARRLSLRRAARGEPRRRPVRPRPGLRPGGR